VSDEGGLVVGGEYGVLAVPGQGGPPDRRLGRVPNSVVAAAAAAAARPRPGSIYTQVKSTAYSSLQLAMHELTSRSVTCHPPEVTFPPLSR